jgi:hypothetical protein
MYDTWRWYVGWEAVVELIFRAVGAWSALGIHLLLGLHIQSPILFSFCHLRSFSPHHLASSTLGMRIGMGLGLGLGLGSHMGLPSWSPQSKGNKERKNWTRKPRCEFLLSPFINYRLILIDYRQEIFSLVPSSLPSAFSYPSQLPLLEFHGFPTTASRLNIYFHFSLTLDCEIPTNEDHQSLYIYHWLIDWFTFT